MTGRRRLSVITIDQALAGGSNVLVALLAASALGAASFGRFGIVFLTYVTAQGVNRALVGEPLLVRPREAQERPGEAIGTALGVGAVLGLVVVAAGLTTRLVDGELGLGLVLLGVALPLLALQDVGRYLGFATQRPALALALDALWLGLVVGTCAVVLGLGADTLAWFVAAWVASGCVAGALVLRQHAGDAVRFGRGWLVETWGLSWRYLVSFSITQGGALASTVALAAIAGAADLGGVRGALLLLSPAITFQIAAGAWGVSTVARAGDPALVRRQARRIAGLCTAVAGVNGVMVLLPDVLGEALLGDSWPAAEPLLLQAWLQTLLLGLVLGARAGLLGTLAAPTNVRLDVLFTPVIVALAVVGTLLDDANGYYWGAVLGQALAVPLWWGVLESRLRKGLVPPVGHPVSQTPGEP